MRLFVKLLIVVLVVALGAPFFMRGPDGQPLLRPEQVKEKARQQWQQLWSDTERSASKAARSAGFDNAGKVVVYRWQGPSGQWHYADRENAPEGAEAVYLDPDTNSYRPAATEGASGDGGSRLVLPTDQAREAREAMEARNAETQERARGDGPD